MASVVVTGRCPKVSVRTEQTLCTAAISTALWNSEHVYCLCTVKEV